MDKDYTVCLSVSETESDSFEFKIEVFGFSATLDKHFLCENNLTINKTLRN